MSSAMSATEKMLDLNGWLEKQGERGIIKGWKKRWFTFRHGKLYYFEKEASNVKPQIENALGFVDMELCTEVREPGPLNFDIIVPGRAFILRCDTVVKKQRWMTGLRKYMELRDANPLLDEAERLRMDKEKLQKELASQGKMVDVLSRRLSTRAVASQGVSIELEDAKDEIECLKEELAKAHADNELLVKKLADSEKSSQNESVAVEAISNRLEELNVELGQSEASIVELRAALKKEKETAASKEASFAETSKRLETELASARTSGDEELKELADQLAEAKARLAASEESHSAQLNTAQASHSEAYRKLTEAHDVELKKATGTIEKLQEAQSDLSSKLSGAQSEMEKKESQFQKELEEMTGHLEAVARESSEKSKAHEQAEKKHQQIMQAAKEEFQEELEDISAKFSGAQQEAAELHRKLEMSEERATRLEERVSDVAKQLETAQVGGDAQTKELSAQLKNAEAKITALNASVASQKDSASASQAKFLEEIRQLNTQLKEANVAVEMERAKSVQSSSDLQIATDELSKAQAEVTRLTNQSQVTDAQLNAAQEKVAGLLAELKLSKEAADAQLDNLTNQLQSLKKGGEEAAAASSKNEKDRQFELKGLRKKLEEALVKAEKVGLLETRIQNLEQEKSQEIVRLSQQNENLQKDSALEIQEFEKKLEDAESRREAGLARVEQTFKVEAEAMKTHIAGLEGQLEAAQKGGDTQLKELSEQLSATQQQLAKEKAAGASAVAEAQQQLIEFQRNAASRVEDLTNQLFASQSQVKSLEATESHQLELMKNALSAQENEYNAQLANAETLLEAEKSAVSKIAAQMEDLRVAGEALDAKVSEMTELAANRDRELAAASTRIDELEAEKSKLQSASDTSEVAIQQVAALENDLRKREANEKRLREEIEQLQAMVANVQKQKESSEKVALAGKEASSQKLSEMKQLIDQLKAEKEQLVAKMKDGESQVSALKLEATVRGRANSVMATQTEKLAEEKEALERELEKLSPRPEKVKKPARMRRSKSGNWTGAIPSADKPAKPKHARRRSLRMNLAEELQEPAATEPEAPTGGGACEQCTREHSASKCQMFVAHAFIANSCNVCYHPLSLHTGPLGASPQQPIEDQDSAKPKKMDINSLEKSIRESGKAVTAQEKVAPAKKIDIAQREKEIWEQTQVKKIDRDLKAPKKLDVAVMANAAAPETRAGTKSPRSYAYQQKVQKSPQLKSDMSLADLRVIISRGDASEFTAELLGKCAMMVEERERLIDERDEQTSAMQSHIDALKSEKSLLEVGVRQHKARTQIIDGLGGNALQQAEEKASRLEVELNGKLALLKQLRKKLDAVKETIGTHETRADEAERKIQGVIDSSKEETTKLEGYIKERDASLAKAKKEKEELTAQMVVLENRVEELTTERTVTKMKIDQLGLQKESLSKQTSELNAALESGALELQRVSKLLQEEKSAHAAVKTQLQSTSMELTEQRSDLERKVQGLESQLKTAQDKAVGLRSQLEASEKGGMAQVDGLNSQLEAAEEALVKLKAERATETADVKKRHFDEVEAYKLQISSVTEDLQVSQNEGALKVSTLENQMREIEGRLKASENSCISLTEALAVEKNHKEEIEVLAKMLQSEKDDVSANYETVVSEKNELAKKEAELQQHADHLKSEVADLLAKYQQIQSEKQILEDSSSQGEKEMSTRLTEKEDQISQLTSQLSNVQGENDELKEELEDLKEELEDLQITEKRLMQSTSSATEQIAELEEHIEDLSEEKTRLESAMLEKQRELNAVSAELNENQTEIISLMKQVAEMRPQAELDAKDRKTAAKFEALLKASEEEAHRKAMESADLQEEAGKLQDIVNQLRADVYRKEQELKAQRGEIRKRTASVVTHSKSVAQMVEQTEMVQQRNIFLTNELLRLESEFHAKLVAKEKTLAFLSGALWDMRENMQQYRRIVFYGANGIPQGERNPEEEIDQLRQDLFFAKAVAIKMRWLMKGISVNANVAELYEEGKSIPTKNWDQFLELQIKP